MSQEDPQDPQNAAQAFAGQEGAMLEELLHDVPLELSVELGRMCQFDFTVGDTSFSFPNVGFRCCLY